MIISEYEFYKPIAPYVTLSYNEQIKKKDALLAEKLKEFQSRFIGLQNSIEPYKPMINDTTIASNIKNFRNKNRFVIGIDETKVDNNVVIGYKCSFARKPSIKSMVHKKTIYCLTNIPDKDIVYPRLEVKQFITQQIAYFNQSKLKPFDKQSHSGFWKFITFRYSSYDNAYTIVYTVETRYTDDTTVTIELNKLVEFCKNTCIKIKSIVVNDSYDKPLDLLIGDNDYFSKSLTEKLDKYLFKIYPNAFFQTNCEIASKMYTLVRNIVESYVKKYDEKSIKLYDLCTGTGTIAMYCADLVDKVIAIDICSDAIENAKENMVLNNIDNIEFICADISVAMLNFTNSESRDIAIATIDPIRSGANDKILEIMNQTFDIIIYVSCNIDSFIKDMKSLTNFKPISVYPFDMFPHTKYYETVNVLVRKIS